MCLLDPRFTRYLREISPRDTVMIADRSKGGLSRQPLSRLGLDRDGDVLLGLVLDFLSARRAQGEDRGQQPHRRRSGADQEGEVVATAERLRDAIAAERSALLRSVAIVPSAARPMAAES
jgi:hypothetical protein